MPPTSATHHFYCHLRTPDMSTASNAAAPSATQLSHTLAAGLQQLGLPLSAATQTQLLDYMALIQKWTKVYNLTAVRDPAEMLTHHLLDSLAVVAPLRRQLQASHAALPTIANPSPATQPPSAKPIRVLDVGSGAGLPGAVLAIVCPELDVTCVDTVAKKAAFIQQAAVTLKLPNLRGVHARVEELKAAPFDVVTSRAFASLLDFVSLTKFHVKQPAGSDSQPTAPTSAPTNMPPSAPANTQGQGGVWMAMKGKHPADEMAALPADVTVFHVEPLDVPGLGAERCLVWMRPAC
jgi:16S rRNA (guanine527-N7)-methyltransferase